MTLASGALMYMQGFEGGSSDLLATAVDSITGTPTVSNTRARTGSFSMQCDPGDFLNAGLLSTVTSLGASLAFYVETIPVRISAGPTTVLTDELVTVGWAATTTSLVYSSPGDPYVAGQTIMVNDGTTEQILVNSVDTTTNTLSVTRGHNGTTGVAHALAANIGTPNAFGLVSQSDGLNVYVAISPFVGTTATVQFLTPATQTVLWTGTAGNIALDTWYCLNWFTYRQAHNFHWPLRVKLHSDGGTLIEDSGLQSHVLTSGSASVGNIQIGDMLDSTASAGSGPVYIDDVVVMSGAPAPIAPKILAIRPNALDTQTAAIGGSPTVADTAPAADGWDNATTTLNISTAASIVVNDTIDCEGERMLVTAKDTTPTPDTITVTRGVDGTTAAAHAEGVAVTHVRGTGGWVPSTSTDTTLRAGHVDGTAAADLDDTDFLRCWPGGVTPNNITWAHRFNGAASGLTTENVLCVSPWIRARNASAGANKSVRTTMAIVGSSPTVSYAGQYIIASDAYSYARDPRQFAVASGSVPWTASDANAGVDNITFGVTIVTNTDADVSRLTQTYLEVAYQPSGLIDYVDDIERLGCFRYTNSGTVSVGSTTTLTDAGQSWHPNLLAGATIMIDSGTGSGQSRHITSNTATTVTISAAWTTNPDSTSKYNIHMTGTATAGAASTLTNTAKAYNPGALIGYRLQITGGTGATETVTRVEGSTSMPQERVITGNTATVLTVAPNWATNPDNTSTYEIFGTEQPLGVQ